LLTERVFPTVLLACAVALSIASCAPTNQISPQEDGEIAQTGRAAEEFELSSLRADPELCKLTENSFWRNEAPPNPGGYTSNATSFPFNPTSLPIQGEIDVAMVFLDWEDSEGTPADYEYYREQAEYFREFYWMASEHTLDMQLHLSDRWYRIPGSYADFALLPEDEAQSGEAPKKQVFYDAAVGASDANVDYSGIDIVFFAIPTGQSVFAHGPHEFNWTYNGWLKTSEGDIYDTATAGDWFLDNDDDEPPWVYYVHEVGHMLGIPHQANEDLKDEPLLHLQNPMNGYEIMANQGGNSRTINSWLRWVAGWLEDDQVICVTQEDIVDEYYELHPINNVDGDIEAVVIKLSDTDAVVVESRRFDDYFDRPSPNSKDGLVVYTVDATRASAQASQALLSPRDITQWIEEPSWRSWEELDAMFFDGDAVEISGLRIEAVRIGNDSDYVRVTAVP
jgi:M6 family metalloprotease-like protein